MTVVLVVTLVLVLSAAAWWSSARSGPRGRVDRAARRADADAVARQERLGIHEPPSRAGL